MNRSDTEGTSAGRVGVSNAENARLLGRWLVIARGSWVGLVVLTWGIFLAGLPLYFAHLQQSCVGEACAVSEVLTPEGIQALHGLGFSVNGYAAYIVAVSLVVVVINSVIGLLIFWRKSNDWMALFVGLFLILFYAGTSESTGALTFATPGWSLLAKFVQFLAWISVALFLYLFPNGKFVPQWTRWLAVVFIVLEVASIFLPPHSPFNTNTWPFWLTSLIVTGFVCTMLFAQLYRYRWVSSPIQRQQTKWVVFGIATALLGTIGFGLAYLLFPTLPQTSLPELVINAVYPLTFLPIPLSIGLAVLRSRLWEIDIIINRTLVYGSLTALLALLYFGLIFALQSLFQGMFHQNNAIAIVVSTLVIAALFQPLRRRIQAIIDRRFYRRKYDSAKIVAAFSATLRSEVDLSQLSEHLLNVVQETMQPAHVSLWLRPPQRHTEESRRLEKPDTMKEGF
jgi:hypothetical protein